MPFLLALFLLTSVSAKDRRCKADSEILPTLINPQGIKSFVEKYTAIQSVGDLICCLPQGFRNNYVVGHSSIAGQNGNATSPRILMHDPDHPGNFISFNGGDPHLNQANSVEYAFHNPTSEHNEYYDIDFSAKSPKMSGPNPSLCMGCHGDDAGRAGPAGARVLWEGLEGEWPRFLLGSMGDDEITGCANEKMEIKLRRLVEAKSLKALKTNPRFACLGPEPDSPGPFDIELSDLAKLTVAQTLPSTPEYEQFQYYFLGHAAGCDNYGDLNPLQKWIPSEKLASMNQQAFLFKDIRESHSAREACLKLQSKAAQTRREIQRQQRNLLTSAARGNLPKLIFDESPLLCSPPNDDTCRDLSDKPPFPLEDQYALDIYFRPSRRGAQTFAGGGEQFDGRLRFVLETRGINASVYSLSPGTGVYQRGGSIRLSVGSLREAKSNNWKFSLARLASKGQKENLAKSIGHVDPEEDKGRLCAELAAKSLAAFKVKTAATQTPQSSSADK